MSKENDPLGKIAALKTEAQRMLKTELETAAKTLTKLQAQFPDTALVVDPAEGIDFAALCAPFQIGGSKKSKTGKAGKPRFTLKKALKVLAGGALTVNEFAKAMQIETDSVKGGVDKYKDKLAIADGKVKLK